MADLYAEIDVLTNPGSAGTAVDPYGWTEFVAALAGAFIPNTWHLRGSHTLTGDWNLPAAPPQTLTAWDINLYGPWRIYGNGLWDYNANPGGGNPCVNGVIAVERAYVFQPTDMHIDLNDATSALVANATRCNFVYRTAFSLGAGATHNLCAWNAVNTNAVNAPGPGATTVSNGVSNMANFAAFDGGDADITDGGGNVFGETLQTPTWDSDYLMLDGSGYGPSWAVAPPAPTPTPSSDRAATLRVLLGRVNTVFTRPTARGNALRLVMGNTTLAALKTAVAGTETTAEAQGVQTLLRYQLEAFESALGSGKEIWLALKDSRRRQIEAELGL